MLSVHEIGIRSKQINITPGAFCVLLVPLLMFLSATSLISHRFGVSRYPRVPRTQLTHCYGGFDHKEGEGLTDLQFPVWFGTCRSQASQIYQITMDRPLVPNIQGTEA